MGISYDYSYKSILMAACGVVLLLASSRTDAYASSLAIAATASRLIKSEFLKAVTGYL